MREFTLTINTTNDAFGEDAIFEVTRILREAANDLEMGAEGGIIFDYNGNSVGMWRAL